ncbi:RIO1 family-domain-containing protein [Mrakia frigida]|uniref:protein kinase RIO2 n=1 Tax=Mrakia frigida TaxID=29902 RepID=UPI003FCC090B
MKLDATDLRYLTADEFRILTAAEMGSKNHEVVPASLIAQISGIRSGGSNKLMGQLAKRNLIARVQNVKYDGYRLTYGGYDYLAIKAMTKRDTIYSVGNQIGVGKESDIYVVADKEGTNLCLKLHRLGRISFRAIKEKRDYMGKRKSASWMYMSRLAAQKEWAFMKVLYANGFPVPTPIDQSRHCILMELIDAYPLRQIDEHDDPGSLYSKLMALLVRFARAGLIHGDFNEFNILIRREDGEPIVIDFPQMVSTSHREAEWYFNRDVACIRTFFRRRFRYESKVFPRFSKSLSDDSVEGFRLDVEVEASGFGKAEAKALEDYMNGLKASGEMDEEEEEDSSDEEESGEEEEEEEGVETRAEEVERLAKEAAEEKDAEASAAPALIPRSDETKEEEVAPTIASTTSNTITSTISNLSSTITESLSSLTHTLTDSISNLTVSTPPQATTTDSTTPAEPTLLPPTSPTGSQSSLPPSSPPAPLRPLPAFHLPPSSPTHSISPSLFSTATTSRSKRPTEQGDVRTTITSDLAKERARTEGKHHARAGVSKAGKAKGTKKRNEGSARLMKAERTGGGGDGW